MSHTVEDGEALLSDTAGEWQGQSWTLWGPSVRPQEAILKQGQDDIMALLEGTPQPTAILLL